MKLGKVIGDGSYSKIYQGQSSDGKIYAIKKIPFDDRGYPCVMETWIMKYLRHPYINSAVDVYRDTVNSYIVQSLADTDLHIHRLRCGILPIDKVLIWFYMIMLAVKELHLYNIIHGDIKSDNILLFGDVVKLNDFSISVRLHDDEKGSWNVFAACYRAPEGFGSNKQWTKSIDIWALGCLLYEMLYGEYLFSPDCKNYIRAINTYMSSTPKDTFIYYILCNRPSIDTLLQHDYFISVRKTMGETPCNNKLYAHDIALYKTYATEFLKVNSKFGLVYPVVYDAVLIFDKIWQQKSCIHPNILIWTCIYMAAKMRHLNVVNSIVYPHARYVLIATEITILDTINYDVLS